VQGLVQVKEGAAALALAAIICHVGTQLGVWLGIPHSTISIVTGTNLKVT
jgi:hypothetical protein